MVHNPEDYELTDEEIMRQNMIQAWAYNDMPEPIAE